MNDFLNNLITALKPMLNVALIVIFAVAVILLFIAILLILRNLRIVKRQKAASKKAARVTEHTYEAYVHQAKQAWLNLQSWAVRTKNFYTNQPQDDVGESFAKVLETLKSYFGPDEAEYRLPWYMVIGAQNSGKTTLLEGVGLELPIGNPTDSITTSASQINWKFYDQGVVADVRGDVLLKNGSDEGDESTWTYILNLFKYYRPKRPLDGIILAIPADEIAGKDVLSSDAISKRGRALYAKIWKLQNMLGMRVPVYVVVTKSDKIPGFSSLVQQIPVYKRQEIFGWSSPYDLNEAFSDDWIDVIFKTLRSSLNRLRSAVFTREIQEDLETGNALLPIEISKMRETLGLYIRSIFKESAYHDSFFLRGVYFTGYGDSEDVIRFLAQQRESGDEVTNPEEGKQVFVQDLFVNKVFSEFAIAEPNTRLIVSTNRVLNGVKVIGGIAAVVWIFGMISAGRNLHEQNKTLIPALHLISNTIIGANERIGGGNEAKVQKYLNYKSTQVLDEFIKINSVDTFSIFLPASWFSIIDKKVQESFTAAYDRIILPSLYGAFIQRVSSIVSATSGIQPAPESSVAFPNPVDSPAFKRLKNYVDEVSELETNVEAYNHLAQTASINDLGRMIRYLFQRELPSQFYANTRYYQEALSKVVDTDISLENYREGAREKLRRLYQAFLLEAFNINDNLPMVVELKKELDAVAQYAAYKKMDEKDLRKLVERAIAVADLSISGQISWLAKQLFDPGPSYNDTLDKIASSKLLGGSIASDLSRVSDQAFVKYRISIAELRTPLLGSIFNVVNGQLQAEPSGALISFINSASSFLGEIFMVPTDAYQLTAIVPPGRLLFWEESTLQKANSIVKTFEDFSGRQLSSYPTKFQTMFRDIGRNATRKKVINFIVVAQNFEPIPVNVSSFALREWLTKQASNVAAVTPIFGNLLGVFKDGAVIADAVNLRELLINQNYGILQRVDELLDEENLYSANNENLRFWKGANGIAFALFGVSNDNGLKDYLAAQRTQIRFLANELAKPILTILSQGFLSGSPRDLPLVHKWTGIVKTLDAYEKKTPGNSLQTLEAFLVDDLNKITLENCLKNVGDFDKYARTGDYFLDIRNSYYERVEKRCEKIGLHQAIEDFNVASAFFNANLSGRFPFTKNPEDSSLPEAEADSVKIFFELYGRINEQQIEMLKHAGRTSPTKLPILKFIENLESIKPLMMASVDLGDGMVASKIDIAAQFLTDRTRSVGSKDIIDWSMNIAGSPLVMGQEGVAVWKVGLPIDMRIKWAQNGETFPMADPRLSEMNVAGSNALFEYDGRWALARLLREHVTQDTEFSVDGGAGSLLLQFDIPTTFNPNCYRAQGVMPFERKSTPARLFMRLVLNIPVKPKEGEKDTAGKSKILTMPMPSFPSRAPLYPN